MNNLRVQQAKIQKKQATHNHLQAAFGFQNLAWTYANPLGRDAAFDSVFNKAVALVEAALINNSVS